MKALLNFECASQQQADSLAMGLAALDLEDLKSGIGFQDHGWMRDSESKWYLWVECYQHDIARITKAVLLQLK